MTVYKYGVIRVIDVEEFAVSVNKALGEGWQLHGEMQLIVEPSSKVLFHYQVMVRTVEQELAK